MALPDETAVFHTVFDPGFPLGSVLRMCAIAMDFRERLFSVAARSNPEARR